jgi:polysaccharide export outer membrane protein
LVGILTVTAVVVVAQDTTYRLKPEDIIRVQIYNEAQVNALLPIGRDGNVSAPFVGTIRAEGMTTAELEAALVKLYVEKLRLREPRVSVTIERFRDIRASVGGLVRNPGSYSVRQGDTVITLLNYAGGALIDRANMKRATLRRGASRELIPLDLQAILERGDTSQNYVIEDGDELIVPEDVNNRILVMGAIAQPGAYPFVEEMALADAISMARGEVPNKSKLSEVLIIREMPGVPGRYLRLKANFVNYVRKGDNSQNVALMRGDLIFVPQTKTPDLNQIGNTLFSIIQLDRLFRDGIFGFRPFGG